MKIVGCNAVIQDKSQTRPGGRRRGTDYTLVPNPDDAIPPLGSKLRITVDAKTYRTVRGFKRGIVANFYPIV